MAAAPELAAQFNGAMSFHTREYSNAIAALPAFAACQTVVDVGGGEGKLVIDILTAYPEMRGRVFDLAVTRPGAERLIQAHSLAERCEHVPGDMFVEVPQGGDVYLLKWVLHDWDDEHALRILQNVRAAMRDSARLILIERVMPARYEAAGSLIQADLNMLCLNGGAERTERELLSLLEHAGFALEQAA